MSLKAEKREALDTEAVRILRSKTFASVALVDEEGRPHVSPVWIDVDGEGRLVVNTAEGRAKARLLQVGAPVRIAAADPENPYRYVDVKGRVIERTRKGADVVIDSLAKKYLGAETYPFRQPGEVRVTALIEPEDVRVN
jgi:PPOX class probable F420-dependent enzyme